MTQRQHFIGNVVSATAGPIAIAVAEAIARAATTQLSRANDAQSPVQVPPVERQVIAAEIAQEAMRTPELRHLSSNEKSVWQSRAHWSMVVSYAAPVLAGLGFALAPEHQELVAGGLWLVSNAVAGWLAYRARTATRPLGS